jgi:hypothetical protein
MIPPEVEKISADYLAIQAYYTRLAEQAEQAIRGSASVPVIPPRSELEVVDGWVVWNGRPVWSAHDNTLADAQPIRSGRTPVLGQSAWVQATEERLDATLAHLSRAEKYVTQGSKPPEVKARLMARIGFYRSLVEQQRLAIHGKAATPELPDDAELEFVDGWLLWRGEPVWWSGYRPEAGSANGADRSTRAAPAPPRSAAEARPKRRHLFRLPWQRAA